MMDILFEIIILLLDILNNPISITGVIIALILGIIMCKIANIKLWICCISICIFITAMGLIACIVGNTPDYLWVPVFSFPCFIILIIIFIINNIFKWIIYKIKK